MASNGKCDLKGPIESQSEPKGTQRARPRWSSIERKSIEECLESLSKFDSSHLGMLSSTAREPATEQCYQEDTTSPPSEQEESVTHHMTLD